LKDNPCSVAGTTDAECCVQRCSDWAGTCGAGYHDKDGSTVGNSEGECCERTYCSGNTDPDDDFNCESFCSSIRPGGIGQTCTAISGSASVGLSTTFGSPTSSYYSQYPEYLQEKNGYLLANCNLCCQAPTVSSDDSSGSTLTHTVTIELSLTFESESDASAFSSAFSSSTSSEKTGLLAAFAETLGVDESALTVVVTGTGTAVTVGITVTAEDSTTASRIQSVAEGMDTTQVQQSIISAIETAGGSSYSFSLEVNDITTDQIESPGEGDAGDGNVATQATLSYAILSTMLSLLPLHH